MITIAIRVDASEWIGIGHMMRCLTLANMLKQQANGEVVFVCNYDLPQALRKQLIAQGHHLELLPPVKHLDMNEDAHMTRHLLSAYVIRWLIVDHYGLDAHWERQMKRQGQKILVIDDLANREHDCDALLDQNLQPDFMNRYDGKVNLDCRLFLGPAFLLLRQEFYDNYNTITPIERLQHVLINFGGSDPTNETEKVLQSYAHLSDSLGNVCFHVVAGPANPRKERLRQLCRELPGTIFYEQAVMSELLCRMDMAIGAGGVTMWERCFMGVPSAVIVVADNQYDSVQEAERLGLVWYMGRSGEDTARAMHELFSSLLAEPAQLTRKSEYCRAFMSTFYNDGLHPVVEYIKGEL